VPCQMFDHAHRVQSYELLAQVQPLLRRAPADTGVTPA